MKKVALIAVLASVAMLFQSAVFAMGPEHTGSWYNSAQSGHGFSIEYGATSTGTPLVVVYWYVYNKDGYPVFLTGTGYPDATGVDITFSAHHGMKFGSFNPMMHQEQSGGVARFTFTDDKNGMFEYFPSTWTIQNFGHSYHQMPITKLFGVTPPDPEPPAISEIEYNDEREFATVFQLGNTVMGSLSDLNDIDWFAVTINNTKTGMVEVNFDVSTMSSGWWAVDWYDPNMIIMSGRNISAPEGFKYQFPAFTAGTYYLRIKNDFSIFYNGGSYMVKLTKVP